MKRILVYGDSNARGDYVLPDGTLKQLPFEQQWPNILQRLLREDYKVIQNGLGGRYAGGFDGAEERFNGQRYYEVVLHSEWPLDFVVIELGANDLYTQYNRQPEQIVDDLIWYKSEAARVVKKYPYRLGMKIPQFIYVPIAEFRQTIRKERNEFNREIVNDLLKQRAENVVAIDKVDLTEDKVHFSVTGHEQMAEAVFTKINELEQQ